jgi:hypothetical protein
VVRKARDTATKFLSSDVTVDGVMSDLTFSNLEIGQSYEVRLFTKMGIGANTVDNINVLIKHNGANIGIVEFGTDVDSGTVNNTNTKVTEFVAEASTVTFQANSIGGTARIYGNGTLIETHARLKEIEPIRETNKWD